MRSSDLKSFSRSLGTISSSRCQTTRDKLRPSTDAYAFREFVFLYGRAKTSRAGSPTGGARRDRTDDLLLAKQALSQLSYGPASHGTESKMREMVGLGRFELPTSRLSSARSNQLSYRPKKHHAAHARPAHPVQDVRAIGCSNDLMGSVGSSEKKEKRRRRSPAKRPDRLNRSARCVPKKSDRTNGCSCLKDHP
jgi:hypothetical protein